MTWFPEVLLLAALVEHGTPMFPAVQLYSILLIPFLFDVSFGNSLFLVCLSSRSRSVAMTLKRNSFFFFFALMVRG